LTFGRGGRGSLAARGGYDGSAHTVQRSALLRPNDSE
jgi:hypothetical protein